MCKNHKAELSSIIVVNKGNTFLKRIYYFKKNINEEGSIIAHSGSRDMYFKYNTQRPGINYIYE